MNIMNYVIRLTKGQDLKKEIDNFVKENNIEAGIVKCAVGCVYEAYFRLAEGNDYFHKKYSCVILYISDYIQYNTLYIFCQYLFEIFFNKYLKAPPLSISSADPTIIKKLTSVNRDQPQKYKYIISFSSPRSISPRHIRQVRVKPP